MYNNKTSFTIRNVNNNSLTRVFIDTSSLLHRAFEAVMKNQLIDILDQNKVRLTVPKIVIKELEKFANDNSSNKAYPAKRALENIRALNVIGYIHIDYHNGRNYICADQYFLEEALNSHSRKEQVLFITQDYNLFKDLTTAIGKISSVGSGNGHYINAKKINVQTSVLEDFSRCYYSKYNQRSDITAALKRFGL